MGDTGRQQTTSLNLPNKGPLRGRFPRTAAEGVKFLSHGLPIRITACVGPGGAVPSVRYPIL